MQRQIREDELRTKRRTQKGVEEGGKLGGGVLKSSNGQVCSQSLYLGGVRGMEGKGDLSGRPFCKAEIQAFPLTLECHSEAQGKQLPCR